MSGITKQEFNIMDQMGASLLASALKEEAELDAKLAQMDNVDEDTFEALRQKRKRTKPNARNRSAETIRTFIKAFLPDTYRCWRKERPKLHVAFMFEDL